MDSQWLKIQFELNPAKTKAGLARAIGLEPPAVSKILKGTRQIKAHEYVRMREYFELNTDHVPYAPYSENTPAVIDTKKQEGFEEMAGIVAAEEWSLPPAIGRRSKELPEQVKIIEIRETIMEPDFKPGDFVLVDMLDRKPMPAGPFIVSDGFGHMVRFCELLPYSAPPQIRISAKAQKFQTQVLSYDDFEIIGRVIAKLEMLNPSQNANQKMKRQTPD